MEDKIKELQKCQLNILTEVDRICNLNNINYFLAYGTCLGAIRHKGFIPWDDDVDICMTIENLNKFKKCIDDINDNFFIQTNETDKNYGLMITRVRDNRTTLIEEGEIDRDINHGVFIDIYPLFSCPNKKIKRFCLIINSMIYRLLLYGKAPNNRGKIFKMGSFILLYLIPFKLRKKILELTYNNMIQYGDDEDYYTTLYGDEVNIIYKKEWFRSGRIEQFESLKVPVPWNAEEYLEFTYGDYLELPPKEKRCVHHNYIMVDTKNSYKKYKGKLFCKQ